MTRLVRAVRPEVAPELEHRVYAESEGLPLFVAEYLAAIGGGEPAAGVPREMRDLVEARVAGLGAIAAPAARDRGGDRPLVQLRDRARARAGAATTRRRTGWTSSSAAASCASSRRRPATTSRTGSCASSSTSRPAARAAGCCIGAWPRRCCARRRAPRPRARGRAPGSRGRRRGAAEQHRLAAEHAASVLAHRDALDHLDAALALGDPDRVGLHERIGRPAHARRRLRGRAVELRGRRRRMRGRCAGAARAQARRRAPAARRVGSRRRRASPSRSRPSPRRTPGLRARILTDLSLTLHQAGEPERAAEIAERGPRAGRGGGRPARAGAGAQPARHARPRGRPARRGAAEFERSLAMAEGSTSLGRTAALNNLALVAREAGEPDRALELTEQALPVRRARAIATARPRSRTTSPISTTPPAATTSRWRTSSAPSRSSRRRRRRAHAAPGDLEARELVGGSARTWSAEVEVLGVDDAAAASPVREPRPDVVDHHLRAADEDVTVRDVRVHSLDVIHAQTPERALADRDRREIAG